MILYFSYVFLTNNDVILSHYDKSLLPYLNIHSMVVYENETLRLKHKDTIRSPRQNINFDYSHSHNGHVFRIDGVPICYQDTLSRCAGTVDHWRVRSEDNGYRIYQVIKGYDLDENYRFICLTAESSVNGVKENGIVYIKSCKFFDDTQIFRIIESTDMKKEVGLIIEDGKIKEKDDKNMQEIDKIENILNVDVKKLIFENSE